MLASIRQRRTTAPRHMYISSQKGHEKILQCLLDVKADIDKARTDNDSTALYISSQNGYEKIVQCLLDAKTDKATTDTGAMPLFISSQNEHEKIVQCLLDVKANIDKATTVTAAGATPLFVSSQMGHSNVVRCLLLVNTNVHAALHDNNVNALHAASAHGHKGIVRMLLKHGAVETEALSSRGTTITRIDGWTNETTNQATHEYIQRKRCANCGKLESRHAAGSCSRCEQVGYCTAAGPLGIAEGALEDTQIDVQAHGQWCHHFTRISHTRTHPTPSSNSTPTSASTPPPRSSD